MGLFGIRVGSSTLLLLVGLLLVGCGATNLQATQTRTSEVVEMSVVARVGSTPIPSSTSTLAPTAIPPTPMPPTAVPPTPIPPTLPPTPVPPTATFASAAARDENATSVAAGTARSIQSNRVVLPDVIGMTYENAKMTLEKLGFKVNRVDTGDVGTSGIVFRINHGEPNEYYNLKVNNSYSTDADLYLWIQPAPSPVPPTPVPPTVIPPMPSPIPAATNTPTPTIEPTAVPAPTAVPPTAVPPTIIPPTLIPPTAVPPTPKPQGPVMVSDPFDYCAQVGTADGSERHQGQIQYSGPEAYNKPFPNKPDYYLVAWRCSGGNVLGCHAPVAGTRAGAITCGKINLSNTPSQNIVEQCQSTPNEFVSDATLGNSAYEWSCKNGRAIITSQTIFPNQVDERGYVKANWYVISR